MVAVFWHTNLTAASMTFSYLCAINSNAIYLTHSISHGCAHHWHICIDRGLLPYQKETIDLEGNILELTFKQVIWFGGEK